MKNLTYKIFTLLPVWLITCVYAFSQTLSWHVIPEKANYPKSEVVVAGFTADVATYGNGVTDATAYLQSLLNQLDKAGGRGINMWSNMELVGGGVLYLPAGKYRIDGKLLVPKGVTIRGDWKKPVKGQAIEGTILMTNQGRNSAAESDAFITMQSGAAIIDVAIWYPQQNGTTPYAPTILMGHPGGPHGDEFCNVKNVTLVNAWDGVIFSQIGGTCPTINGLYGTPLHQGVEIDRIVDIGRIEHIDFSPAYWAHSGLEGSPDIDNATFKKQLYDHATGVVMRRNDWSYTLYLKVDGYNKGFHTTKTRDVNDQATPNGHNYGFEFINCKYGLYFDSRAGEGCMFTEVKTEGCEFGAFFSGNAGGVAQFYKWDLSAAKCAIYTDKNASTKITMIESTVRAGKILLQGGTFMAVNNDFNNPKPQIEFEGNSRGDITGNRFAEGVQILEKSIFQNVINHEPVTMTPLPAYRNFVPHTTKPSGTAFIVATDAPYSVPKGRKDDFPITGSATANDATNAIQQALNEASQQGGGIVYLPPGHYRIDGQLTIPSGVELKGSMDVSAFPLGPGSVLEIYNQTDVAVIMNANSGMRGINFNYPTQVYCAVMPNPIDFPFTIRGNGENIYIVNVAMRCSNRGVDLFSNRCDNFYIDYLTGYFFREGVNIKNSKDGVLSNMQCNTIVYNNGDEVKFGQYPNSNRSSCGSPADKDPYLYNSRNMTFLALENVEDIFLYGNFNYNALVGIHAKNNVSGLALGFALDDDRTMLLLDGSNIHLDFINLQGVALQRGTSADGLSSYIKTTSNYTADGNVTLFNSDYWGYAGESGIVMNGAGTLNIYGGNFMHSGENSFANVNNGYLNVIGSAINPANVNRNTYTGSARSNITTIGSITKGDASVDNSNQTNITHTPTTSPSGVLNDCNLWTATATFTNGGAAQNMVDCNTSNTWNSGWQNQGTGRYSVTVTVDMKSQQTFNQVILAYGSAPNDGPETYVLEVSADGSNWTEVAKGSGRNTSMTSISFQRQTARYVRITKPESNTNNFWAIDNFYVANLTLTEIVPEESEEPCDPVRTLRIVDFGGNKDGVDLSARYLRGGNNGILSWSETADANCVWYEIPVSGSTTDFYLKNIESGKYIYRDDTGVKIPNNDWEWEAALLSDKNEKSDYYKFRFLSSTWGGRFWIANVAAADFSKPVSAKSVFVLSGINKFQDAGNPVAYPSVVMHTMPNDNNIWTSTTIEVVNVNVMNPDCENDSIPNYPKDYPQTMAMNNPLFWQFGSEMVNSAGELIRGTEGNLYTADASARVWNIDGTPTLFIYASHDMEQAVGCDRMDRYHVFSTTDMVNWTDYGEIFNAGDVPWHNGTFRNNSKFMWAPDCVYKNGKYYFYFPHPSQNSNDGAGSWSNNWQTGIAVSEHPASGFTVLPQPLKGLNNAQNHIDPCVFIDDDGQAYFYNGGGGRCYGGKLKDNMIEIDGDMQEMEGLNNFHEAAWVHKYNGKYYLSHSDNGGGGANNGDQLKCAVSDHPLGSWTDMGVYIYATGCGTNHGSIVEFNGQWYAFYHTDYVSNIGELRSVHVDKLYYNPDGSIQLVNTFGTPFKDLKRTVVETDNTADIALVLQAEDFNDGGETYGYHDRDKTPRNVYRPTIGMTIEERAGGTYNLGNLGSKEFTRYTIYVEKAGLYDIDYYVASTNNDGRFHLNVNGVNKSGTVAVTGNGGWGDSGFAKFTAPNILFQAGENLFELRIETGGFNIDRFEFRKAQPYAGTPFKENNVQGKIEAEDFDNGGPGVAYYDTTPANQGGYNYRPGESVDIENSAGSIHISHTVAGEWLKYTLNVKKSGTYNLTTRVSTGNGSSGSLAFSFDDVYQYPSLSATTASWNTYTEVTLQGIELMQGTHVMTVNMGGNINIDWYNFIFVNEIITSVTPSNLREGKIKVYPNPTTGVVYLNSQFDIKVFNIQGVLLKTAFGSQIDLSDYPAGIYLLKINNEWKRVIKTE